MREERRTVFVLSAVVFLVLLGITLLTPILPFYAMDLGATEVLVAVIIAGVFVARIATDLPAGILGDRHGQRRIMSYGLLAIAASVSVAGLAFDYRILLAVRLTEGLGSALYVTSSTALLAKAVPMERRGRYMGYYVSALLVGAVLGPGVGGLLASLLGVRAVFFVYALMALAALVLIRVYLPTAAEGGGEGRVAWAEISLLLRDPSFLLVNGAVLSAFFVRGGINLLIFPLWAAAKFNIGFDLIGGLLTLSAVAALGTLIPAGRIADSYGRKPPFVASLLLTALVLPFLFLSDDFLTLTLSMVLYGLALGIHGPLAAWAADLVPEENMGTAMGLYRTLGDLGWVLGILVLGAIASLTGPISENPGNPWPFFVASLWLVVSGLLLLLARDPVAERAIEVPVM